MKHWTKNFFDSKGKLWLDVMNTNWARAGSTVKALIKILKKHGIKKGRILELGCGNGRICIYMANKGFDMTGIDISPLYISDAIKKMQKHKVKVNFINGDIRHLRRYIKQRFDVIPSIWTSLGYYDKKTDQKILSDSYKLLKKKGLLLILNTMSMDYLTNHYYPSPVDESKNYVILHKQKFDRHHGIMDSDWIFYRKTGRDLKYIDTINIKLRIYYINEMIEMAEKAGFRFIAAYDSILSLSPAKIDSPINLVFRKE